MTTAFRKSHLIDGVGIGLRAPHYQALLNTSPPPVPWLEVLTDNFLGTGGLDRQLLFKLRETYPMTLHGVGLSLGSLDPLDTRYLKTLRQLTRDLEASWVSEHLAFVSRHQRHYHDLLPLPYTEEALRHLSHRITQVQDFLGEQILIENVSSYIRSVESEMSEGEFMAALSEQCDCLLLLDINNAYVNQCNHGWDAREFMRQLPIDRVREIHLAGFSHYGHGVSDSVRDHDFLIDTHSRPVDLAVWQLYEAFQQQHRVTKIPALIEWDKDIPDLDVLLSEAHKANSRMKMAFGKETHTSEIAKNEAVTL